MSSSISHLPYSADDQDDNAALLAVSSPSSASTASHDDILDRLLSRVGYGRFQRKLLILCGFGWLADNMWLQSIAIILPRVQESFNISDQWIGTLSSSLFCGMMVGAFFWGTYSDKCGRKLPYTMTLTITTFFGILSTFAFSFWSLCVCLFCLGFGVGGNMPTDGALYLEFLPKDYHYLLTFMSVFFSFGAVLASVAGYIILPNTGCSSLPTDGNDSDLPVCDPSSGPAGWRVMLFSVAMVTLVMLAFRTLWLRLPETPKFLMRHDLKDETIIVLQDIARINGGQVNIARGELDVPFPLLEQPLSPDDAELDEEDDDGEEEHGDQAPLTARRHRHVQYDPTGSGDSLDNPHLERAGSIPEHNWALLFAPKWRLTTLLVWGIWTFTSMAYTMFNVFLPKYLETLGFAGEAAPTRKDVYWDYMVYSFAGVPGSVMASYLIETPLGRKGTMAASAFGSAGAMLIFSIISSRVTMLISSSAVSFLATLLYAVIYGYTPEVFDTAVRGTAVGIASGLGRIAGIVSPIVSGILFSLHPVLALYVSVGGFLFVGVCVVLLPYETRQRRTDGHTPLAQG